jgi:hypothetical protein
MAIALHLRSRGGSVLFLTRLDRVHPLPLPLAVGDEGGGGDESKLPVLHVVIENGELPSLSPPSPLIQIPIPFGEPKSVLLSIEDIP